MGFQVPPTLPDYSKLIAVLNESKIQSWNPPIYQILTQLIQAAMQGQKVLSNNITNINSGSSGVLVDPNGAILGDGAATPLKCQVDGTTIQILGDTLVATAGLVAFGVSGATPFFNGTAGPGGFVVAPNTTVLTVPAVPGFVIAPIKVYVSAHQDDNGANNALWSPTMSLEVVYNRAGFPVIANPAATVFSAAVGTHDQSSINEPVSSLVAGAILNAFKNIDVIVRTNNTINCVSTANKFISNNGIVGLAYLLIPA